MILNESLIRAFVFAPLLFFMVGKVAAQKPKVLLHEQQWQGGKGTTLVHAEVFFSNQSWSAAKPAHILCKALWVDDRGQTVDSTTQEVSLAQNVTAGPDLYLNTSIVIPSRPGSYTLRLLVKDVGLGQDVTGTAHIKVKDFNGKAIQVAKPALLSDYSRVENQRIPYNSGLKLEYFPVNFLTQDVPVIHLYDEIYHEDSSQRPHVITAGIANASGQFLEDFSFSKKPDKGIGTVLIRSLSIKDLPSGSYQLRVTAFDKQMKALSSDYVSFTRSNPPADGVSIAGSTSETRLNIAGTFVESLNQEEVKKYLAALIAIATESEKKVLPIILEKTDILGQKQYLLSFWQKRSAKFPDQEFEEFKKRLKYAQQRYAVKGLNVFETDRGRVLLQYGFPSQVENELTDRQRSTASAGGGTNLRTGQNYEIWYYYNLNSTAGQGNASFVFLMDNAGINNYRLINSTAIGEINNPNWRSMLGR